MPQKIDTANFYRRIIASTWRTAWGHKHLWLFGFFATFAGFGGVYEIFLGHYDRVMDLMPAMVWLPQSPLYLLPGAATLKALVAYSPNPLLSTFIFLVIAALVSAVFIWVIIVAIGALIGGVDRISRGGDADFGAGISFGAKKFWRLLAIIAASKALIAVAVILTGTNLLALVTDRSFTGGAFYLGSFIVFSGIAIIASIVSVYAGMNSALRDEKFVPAVIGGWNMFKANWLISLETSLVLLAANLVIVAALIAVFLVLSVPVITLVVLAAAMQSAGPLLAVTVVSGLAVMTAIVAYASFMTTFQVAAWHLVWNELAEKRPRSKLQRMSDWISGKLKK